MEHCTWPGYTLSRIALGTVQLGLPYGIANRSGQPDFRESREIVKTAWERGINCFDTAQSYGESEQILGKALRSLGITEKALVITKLGLNLQGKPAEEIFLSIQHSREVLGVPRLFGVLLHRGSWLKAWGIYGPALKRLKKEGIASFVGVSIYTEEEIEQAFSLPEIDLIQAPFNVFDQRAVSLKWFEKARLAGKLIVIRSVFLQGLLVMPLSDLSRQMEFARKPLERYQLLCKRSGTSLATMALGYVAARSSGAVMLLGAETAAQIKENCAMLEVSETRAEEIEALFGNIDRKISNPALWPVERKDTK
ncbi:MAG: aldo/keto reductase [bacterium]